MGLELFSLQDRVAIVTGGGRGIGRALAVGLAEAGAQVVVAARTASEIDETAALVRAKGKQALAVPTDVGEDNSIGNLVQETLKRFGQIDILVNNAGGVAEPGGALTGFALSTSQETWDAVQRKNLKSAFLCSRAVAQPMKERRCGAIINIGSTSGLFPDPPMAAYGVAKAGVIYLTKVLAQELAPFHVRVNCVCPGFIGTPRVKQRIQLIQQADPQFLPRAIALGRLGEPQDLVGPVVYFASEASSYVTGEVLSVNGGRTGYLPATGPASW